MQAPRHQLAPLLRYSAPAIPLAVMLLPLNALLPFFYNQVVGLSAFLVGAALLATRLFDGVVDPFFGWVSDRTRHYPLGRRLWMVAGVPIFMTGCALLFYPADLAGFLYLCAASGLAYLGWSLIQIPYLAWGGEAITDYAGRAQLAGFREAGTMIGILLAAAIPLMTALYGHAVDRVTVGVLGAFLLAAMPISVAIALRSLPAGASAHPSRRNLQSRNDHATTSKLQRPFLMILYAFIAIGLGKGISNALTIYFATFVLEAPKVVGAVLFAAYAGTLLGNFCWVRAAQIIGKHRAVAASLIATVMILLLGGLPLGPGDGRLFIIVEFFVGIAAAGYLVLPSAIVADAVDYDTLKTGRERYGLHFAVWSMTQKLVNAAAVGIALPALSFFGMDAKTMSPQAIDATRLLYLLAPAPLFAVGALVFWNFPITGRRHAAIRRRIYGYRAA
jgi:glycoside/pentoside/hexuronide:cation symporter, GPH family